MRHGRLRRITVDHNYVQELVNTGHITDDEARTHPRRNIITRALGIDPSVRVDAWTLPIVRGDRFVVCSDGLSDEVHDTEIHQILTTVDDTQAAAEELVAAANRQGGRDNVSVIVVDVLEGVDPPGAGRGARHRTGVAAGAGGGNLGGRRPVVGRTGGVRGSRRPRQRPGRAHDHPGRRDAGRSPPRCR